MIDEKKKIVPTPEQQKKIAELDIFKLPPDMELPPDHSEREDALEEWFHNNKNTVPAKLTRKEGSEFSPRYEIDNSILDDLRAVEGLTFMERSFTLYYALSGDVLWAMESAGYKHPRSRKAALLSKKAVKACLEIINEHINSALIWDAARVRAFWTTVAEDSNYLVQHRLKASELLGKAQGQFVERLQLEQHSSHTERKELTVSFQNIGPGSIGRLLGLDPAHQPEQKVIEQEPENSPETSLDDIL